MYQSIVGNFWMNMAPTVAWADTTSKEFGIHQGVWQGGKSFSLLYKIFLNDLHLDLEKQKSGLSIGVEPIACPTVADDVLLLFESQEDIQNLLKMP